jgi:hypothetical protein
MHRTRLSPLRPAIRCSPRAALLHWRRKTEPSVHEGTRGEQRDTDLKSKRGGRKIVKTEFRLLITRVLLDQLK